ncbi:MAG: TonB-dependent receptor plug domain-containing protein [Elusimicrobia bacterium]|nr:TonB-dependent receptor plug domain-containing protein [Candidatus Liberimonas magnetica]
MPKIQKVLSVILMSFLCFCASLYAVEAADKADDLLSMSLEDLLSMKITVASVKGNTVRESPGIVTLITRDEIVNSGAQNITDILRLVPGIGFGVDVQGAVGLGVRGNWAHEGKAVILWDGFELNELLYSCLQFNNRFSLDQIKQIEIIRGPGSAIYGGFAELAVINIVTKSAKELNGLETAVNYAQMSKPAYSRQNISLLYGKELANSLNFVGSAFVGQSRLSDRIHTDMSGNSFNMSQGSAQDPFNSSFKLNYKGFETAVLVDRYQTLQRDEYGTIDLDKPVNTDFESYYAMAKYNFNVSDKITVTPKFNYKFQIPWKQMNSNYSNYFSAVERYTSDLSASYNPSEKVNILAGVEYYNDNAEDKLEGSARYNGSKNASYFNIAEYLQCLFNLPIFNVTVGARSANHSQFGSSFVPRFALTKVIGNFHFKVLYSKAYREPSIENIALNPEIKPENTTVSELEAGYQLSKNQFVTANIFNINIEKPIVYGVDPGTAIEAYYNYDKVKTQGAEFEYRLKYEKWYTTINYAYYEAMDNTVTSYEVTGNKDELLGFSPHKASLNSSFSLTNNLSVNPSLVYISERYGYYTYDYTSNPAGDPVLKKFDPVTFANLYFHFNNFVSVSDLTFGIGVYNILDSEYAFIQPYNGGHAPLQGPSREVVTKLTYKFK